MSFIPDASTLPDTTWLTAILSQRDLSLKVPINFVTQPGVSLLSVCFSDRQYLKRDFERCLSNLLAFSFRRLVFDLYWDLDARVWSLCPVRRPSYGSDDGSETTTKTTSSTATDAQVTGKSESSNSKLTTNARSTSTFHVGDYVCDPAVNIDLLFATLESYYDRTSNTLEAGLTYLILNLHVSAADSSITNGLSTPSLNDSAYPAGDERLGAILDSKISAASSDYLYTPSTLTSDRADLDDSWRSVPQANWPASGYMTMHTTDEGSDGETTSTSDGWPNESYIEFFKGKRVLCGFGTLDLEIASYNTAEDGDIIFGPGALQHHRNVTQAPDGQISQGCLFDPASSPSINTAQSSSSSWATTALSQSIGAADLNAAVLDTAITNLTACGISPMLNTSFGQFSSPDTAPGAEAAYASFARSAIWSWQDGQPLSSSPASSASTPLTSTAAANASSDISIPTRCAAMDLSASGHWRALDCALTLPSACQDNSNPFLWTVSSTAQRYDAGNSVCGPGSTFMAPHTAVENAYLRAVASSSSSSTSSSRPDKEQTSGLIWLNLNSLDLPDCWVIGIGTPCPYGKDQAETTRSIAIPTVAAVIVLFLTALTVFIKCAANRTESVKGRRRKKVGGWDYEGVPS